MDAAEYEKRVGVAPEHDDLERVNCEQAGQFGHWHCGWCKHDKPVFMCGDCALERINASVNASKERRIAEIDSEIEELREQRRVALGMTRSDDGGYEL